MSDSATVAVKFLEFNKVEPLPQGEDGHFKAFLFQPIIVSTLTAATTGTSNYTVTLNLETNVPHTVIHQVDRTSGPTIHWTIAPGGQSAVGTFSNEGVPSTGTRYGYKLTILVGEAPHATPFESTDPEIVIPPPNG
jgi:hypothetical protein